MKNNNEKTGINSPQLLKFAQHLESKELNDRYIIPDWITSNRINLIHGDNGQFHQIFPFILNELPNVFNQWYLSKWGYITYVQEPGQQSTYSLLEFFRLPAYQMLHCFAINKQHTEKYGGNVLTITSLPRDIANNIYGLIESNSINSVNDKNLLRRRVLFEKIIQLKIK